MSSIPFATSGKNRPDTGRLLPLRGRIYVWAIVAAGFAALTHASVHLYVDQPSPQWLLLACLTLFSGSFTVRVPSIPATISVSETFVFTTVLLFGPAPATITVALDGLIISLWSKTRVTHRSLFNTAEPALSIWVASQLFFLASGVKPLSEAPAHISALVLPLLLLTATYFLLNSWLTAIAVALSTESPVWPLWRGHFMWLALSYFGGASVAALLVQNSRGVDPLALSVILPLLVISYLTFKTALGRVEDANAHLAESNRLYISTVEALAMAIDAKDQITHGHIRRVQVYAVALAKALGVRDSLQLKAIEAAALLHDMGKLAVPEYILNKPGKLTPAEFEKMKLHAAVGADILSSIHFPYPVVPIVRHHHENWNGSGYPDRIAGTDIPIGARILSVVDCFDALTSDRPYRPALSDEQAIQILLDRRGSMYDPLVVDTFLTLYPTLEKQIPETSDRQPALVAITEAALNQTDERRGAGHKADVAFDQVLSIYELARALPPDMGFSDAADIIGKHLIKMWTDTSCLFYIYDQQRDVLTALHSVGSATASALGLRIPLGQRLSGWVAAHRKSVVNSDPLLDLNDVAPMLPQSLRSTLAAPLMINNELIGVLSVYSPEADRFADEHRQILEAVARHTAPLLRESLLSDATASALRDQETGLPNVNAYDRFMRAESQTHRPWACPFSVCKVVITSPQVLAQSLGSPTAGDAAGALGRELRSTLRGGDLVFRCDDYTYIILLPQTDQPTADLVAGRVRDIYAPRNTRPSLLPVDLTVATAPEDGSTLTDLVAVVSCEPEVK